jgi:hypothetical protein
MLKKIVTAFTLCSCASLAFAGEHWNLDAGDVSMKYLSMQVSARSAALSGAGVADATRASDVQRNPLAMSSVTEAEAGVNHIIFPEYTADDYTTAYIALPFTAFNYPFTFSAGAEFLGYDGIEGRDEEGFKTADYGAYAWTLQAGLGNRGTAFSWAATARFSQQTIDDESAIALLGDIGGAFRVNRYFAFGATLTNAGYMGDYDGETEHAPMALQAGITGIVPVAELFNLTSAWNVHLSADAYRRADMEDPEWRFGGEIDYMETIALRIGYAARPDTEDGVSAGIGFCFGMINFDYAYSPKKAFDGGYHYLTLGLRF